MNDLTEFQKTILHVLAEESRYGLAVKEELERFYGEEVNHGRLYPNLDSLVDEGFVDKRSRDDRTNLYHLTEEGESVLTEELEWRIRKLVSGDQSLSDRLERALSDAASAPEPADVNEPV